MNKIKTFTNSDTIDLRNLNMFETAKRIIMISTDNFARNPNKKFKYRVSCPNIEKFLKDIPLTNTTEIVYL